MIPEQLEDLRSGQFCGWLGGVIPIARSFCKPRFFPQNQHDFVLPGDVSAKGSKTQAIQLGCDADKMPVIGESLTLLLG